MRHPTHPALVHLPIACWVLVLPCDLATFWFGSIASTLASLLLAIGCSFAPLAMIAGLLDLARIVERQALRIAYLHMLLMLITSLIFTLRLVVGLDQWQPRPPDPQSLSLDIFGLICLLLGAWLGGELVYQHGIGTAQQRDKQETHA